MPATQHAKPPSANPEHPDPHAPDGGNHPDDAKADSAAAKSDPSGVYVLAFTPNGGGAQVVELHTEETAASRVSLLTYASKQHRRELADADEPSELPEGGGSHEINRKDIKVYKLSSSEVTDF